MSWAAVSIAVPTAPVAVVSLACGVIVTVGEEVYPVPLFVMVNPVMAPLKTVAVAVAPVPPPPDNETVGTLL